MVKKIQIAKSGPLVPCLIDSRLTLGCFFDVAPNTADQNPEAVYILFSFKTYPSILEHRFYSSVLAFSVAWTPPGKLQANLFWEKEGIYVSTGFFTIKVKIVNTTRSNVNVFFVFFLITEGFSSIMQCNFSEVHRTPWLISFHNVAFICGFFFFFFFHLRGLIPVCAGTIVFFVFFIII
jgi:hypothetical protein